VASLSQGRTAAAQCGLFTHKSVPVIFEPPCNKELNSAKSCGNHFPQIVLIGYVSYKYNNYITDYFTEQY